VRFEVTASDVPPANELLEALRDEYAAIAGTSLTGGPSAEPADFAPPGGAFLVAYDGELPVACGGLKTVATSVAEIKRMYVTPGKRGGGVARALLNALEQHARAMGFRAVRLDSQRHTWPIYQAAGYREIPDYNGNPHAHHWGEKRLEIDDRRDTGRAMSRENLELVQSICSAWGRGDYSPVEWAHPGIEFVVADGPSPGRWTGLAGMAEGWRSFLEAWDEFHQEADEYRELDGGRVLVFFRGSGRGKTSGLDLAQTHHQIAGVFHIRDRRVTRFLAYFDPERALADVGDHTER